MNKSRSVVIQNRAISYTLRRSRRAKNVLLRVKLNGAVEVVVPWRVSFKRAERFVQAQSAWVQRVVKKNKKRQSLARKMTIKDGALLPVFGDVRQLQIKVDLSRRRSHFKEKGDSLYVYANNKEAACRMVLRWYQARTKRHFTHRVKHFSSLAGTSYLQLVVSNASTQWGSCNQATGRLSLNWQLAQVPLTVADYVIAHEVAHLKVANHSPSFWAEVEKLHPEYQECRKWLRKEGRYLLLENKFDT